MKPGEWKYTKDPMIMTRVLDQKIVISLGISGNLDIKLPYIKGLEISIKNNSNKVITLDLGDD